MNILITGVHGFVGSNLVKALSPENTIYGLDIVAPEKDGIVKTFSWDDLGGIDLPQIDAVIHLAGKAHDTRIIKNLFLPHFRMTNYSGFFRERYRERCR